jgi:hypothetical protein
MAALTRRIKKNVDYLYLSLLVILSASIVTLLLYSLYYWYTKGVLPIAGGSPAIVFSSEETIRFVIGGLYVPLLVAFSGIAIAYRLKATASPPFPLLPHENGKPLEMTLKSNSYVLDTSHQETVKAEYKPTVPDITAPEAEKELLRYSVCPACDTKNQLDIDYCINCGEPLTLDRDSKKPVAEVKETDILEQLRDPVNREKLVSLLLEAEV